MRYCYICAIFKAMLQTDLYIIPSEDKSCVHRAPSAPRVLVAVRQEDFTPEAEALLQRIMQSVRTDYYNDCALLVLSSNTFVRYYNAVNIRNVRQFLTFGVPFSRLGLMVRARTHVFFRFRGMKCLLAVPLVELLEEKRAGRSEKRRALWNQLQQMFELKKG